jgi:hypothetical protein
MLIKFLKKELYGTPFHFNVNKIIETSIMLDFEHVNSAHELIALCKHQSHIL